MLEQFQQLDHLHLSELLLIKNKELTDGMKQGKKNKELRTIYEEIQLIYQEIKQRRSVLMGSTSFFSYSTVI